MMLLFLPFLGIDDFMRVPDFKRIFFTKYIPEKHFLFLFFVDVFLWNVFSASLFLFSSFFLLFFVFCAHKTKGRPL